ncbi:MAG TPA: zinc ribbon domain-containing protein [Gemmatimonadales bacterium]|nr:zinc ribbon domain-containing protein [Gemmatimonadales bacterium]
MTATRCDSCGMSVPAHASFCPGCGSPARRERAAGGGGRLPLAVVTVGIVALVLALSWSYRKAPPAAAPGVPVGGDVGAPPDISNMSPRERFDRLYNRSMQAVESGDGSSFGTFAPMALLAYSQLDTVDNDARYHAAMLELHRGDASGATLLADSILAGAPGHLFGYVIRGTVAQWQHDSAGLAAAQRDFRAHYEAEMAAGRPEYADHRAILERWDSGVGRQTSDAMR